MGIGTYVKLHVTTKGSDDAAWVVSMPLFDICMMTKDNLDAGLQGLIYAWENSACEFINLYEWICPPLQPNLIPFFVGKEYQAHWTGLHVNWSAWELDSWKLDCMEIGQFACLAWSLCMGDPRLHAGEEDCMLEQRIVTLWDWCMSCTDRCKRRVEREFIRLLLQPLHDACMSLRSCLSGAF